MKKRSLKELNRLSVEAFKASEKTPVVIVLDNIRSALNVGSAFRTADAFAIQKIYLCGISAKPPHREILKTAIGATESVDWVYIEDVVTAIQELKTEGYQVLAIEQTDESVELQAYPVKPNASYALVFGNEVKGVSDAVLPLVNGAVEIPQFGTKHSLNISVCLGILCWSFFRQMRYTE
ncbi:MAG: TrmH family RNA methyltransferase [Bacteroidota bacterium]